jgi:hypothetical protein
LGELSLQRVQMGAECCASDPGKWVDSKGMKYAVTPPPEPGYYWLKDKEGEAIVEVWSDPGNPNPDEFFIHHCGSGDVEEVSRLNEVLWAGPIPTPSPLEAEPHRANSGSHK